VAFEGLSRDKPAFFVPFALDVNTVFSYSFITNRCAEAPRRQRPSGPLFVLREITMKFGYTIVYVPDVEASIGFFENAFGLKRRFVHPSGYGELDTGATTLAFASHALGASHFPDGYVRASDSDQPLGVEVALVTSEVAAAHQRAVAAGALELTPPTVQPWGQTVSYVHCPDGTLVELCTPMA
jgi:catechol 2,3-dioxygenase-like lactoylglutathione lyase family enzyme